MMVFIAVIAVGLRLLEFPMAPLLLGFILGGMLEDNLRRAIILSDGSFGFLLGRPTTVVLLSLTVVTLISPLLRKLYRGIRSGN